MGDPIDHTDEEPIHIPEHHAHTSSRLEPYQSIIATMRSKGWPYRRIVAWLKEEKSLTISWEALRQFCIYRQIQKGKPAAPAPPPLLGESKPVDPPRTRSDPKGSRSTGRKFVLNDDSPPTPTNRS